MAGLPPGRRSDLSVAKAWQRALEMTTPIAAEPERIFPVLIEEVAHQFGDAPAIVSAAETLSYQDWDRQAKQYARWALAQGLGKGKTVCLLLRNCPQYLAIWLGI